MLKQGEEDGLKEKKKEKKKRKDMMINFVGFRCSLIFDRGTPPAWCSDTQDSQSNYSLPVPADKICTEPQNEVPQKEQKLLLLFIKTEPEK